MLTQTPNGLAEMRQVFGNENTQNFEAQFIKIFDLPYPLLYAGQEVAHARCHYLIIENFQQAFQQIMEKGLMDEVKNYGGIYQVRAKRGQKKLSTHAWGIAIDLEPEKYPLSSKGRFPDEVVQAFKDSGFFYGGDFKSRLDPMHFQFCSGY
jgi:hypothetical protein